MGRIVVDTSLDSYPYDVPTLVHTTDDEGGEVLALITEHLSY